MKATIGELIGTFTLVFVGTATAVFAGSGVLGEGKGMGILAIAFAFGFTLLVLVYAVGPRLTMCAVWQKHLDANHLPAVMHRIWTCIRFWEHRK